MMNLLGIQGQRLQTKSLRKFVERYPNGRFPHPTIFASGNRKRRDSGSGHIKSLVYVEPVPSVENLIARISVGAGRLSDMPGIVENVRSSMQSHCQTCQVTSDCNFEHLL
ncbi:hypothetical protein TNCV_2869331 [Trichonephila clavipes]|nr:hypothetical protein TNCV_2869331 [Trichonephila clavipes]